jgi:hypothetical protein
MPLLFKLAVLLRCTPHPALKQREGGLHFIIIIEIALILLIVY